MTTREAIEILNELHDQCCQADSIFCTDVTGARCDAVDMAIEALSRSEIPNTSEPKCADGCIYGWGSSECGHCDYRSEEPKTGDCISRQAAIDAINKMKIYRPLDSDRYVISDCLDKIVNLPSAQPDRKYTLEEVAEILATTIGDECACNINGIDEWLPESCKYTEIAEECPNPKEKHGCWMQYLLQGGSQI